MNTNKKTAKKRKPLSDTSNRAAASDAWARAKMRQFRGSSESNPWVLDAEGALVLQDQLVKSPARQKESDVGGVLRDAISENLKHLIPSRATSAQDRENSPPDDESVDAHLQGVVRHFFPYTAISRPDWLQAQIEKSPARAQILRRSAEEKARIQTRMAEEKARTARRVAARKGLLPN
ncbi:hypothetical protein R3P38DRAFT_3173194 [Favolaschia claudopus]|uniref:Uncharacterized protein n=1 Tax=Favolaschia claudopus TaxID=2862362 RepID=A0AAW0DBQ2_9AGAR